MTTTSPNPIPLKALALNATLKGNADHTPSSTDELLRSGFSSHFI